MNAPWLDAIDRTWLEEIRSNAVRCEALRPQCRKPHKTGTISEAACLYLRALVRWAAPAICLEIGTFIGTSALVLASEGAEVHTCDKDNEAFTSTDSITCYGRTTSTAMLAQLVNAGIRADLVFLDGRLQDEDLTLLAQVTRPGRTVYAMDDYEVGQKGMANANKLKWIVDAGYTLWTPPASVLDLASRTTIAAMTPKGGRR